MSLCRADVIGNWFTPFNSASIKKKMKLGHERKMEAKGGSGEDGTGGRKGKRIPGDGRNMK